MAKEYKFNWLATLHRWVVYESIDDGDPRIVGSITQCKRKTVCSAPIQWGEYWRVSTGGCLS